MLSLNALQLKHESELLAYSNYLGIDFDRSINLRFKDIERTLKRLAENLDKSRRKPISSMARYVSFQRLSLFCQLAGSTKKRKHVGRDYARYGVDLITNAFGPGCILKTCFWRIPISP